MSKHYKFNEWISKTPEQMFGFSSIEKESKKPSSLYDIEPLEPLEVSQMMNELSNMGNVGTRQPNRLFENMIEYGNDIGKLIVEVSPFGSLKIILRRQIKNLVGEDVEVCKKIIPLTNDYNHIGPNDIAKEVEIASHMHRILSEIDKNGLETPSPNYKGLRDLTIKMAQNMRANHPKVMIYNGVIQNNENYYTIYFSFTGEGVEAPGANRVEQFNVNLSYYPQKGLIRCWGNDIVSPIKRRSWKLQPSEWDEYFAPSQEYKEIVHAITEAFSTY